LSRLLPLSVLRLEPRLQLLPLSALRLGPLSARRLEPP
jgi:hypothetical protein